MRQIRIGVVTVVMLVLASGALAHADVILVTPAISSNGKFFACIATNFDKKNATVTAEIYNTQAGFVTPDTNTCTTPLEPGKTCFVNKNPAAGSNLCRVVSSSKHVHAALQVFDPVTDSVLIFYRAQPF